MLKHGVGNDKIYCLSLCTTITLHCIVLANASVYKALYVHFIFLVCSKSMPIHALPRGGGGVRGFKQTPLLKEFFLFVNIFINNPRLIVYVRNCLFKTLRTGRQSAIKYAHYQPLYTYPSFPYSCTKQASATLNDTSFKLQSKLHHVFREVCANHLKGSSSI